ncbi:hypothetical protein SPACI_052830 [Sporomusa acidovorans DSM 3132]|uniref:HD domain-containing protein n=2 Tax=Sporomusa TaxID=2375 RepID=A0ABZ3JAP3_SPOA4|nr:HD domain-containing protein [Sporomusa acidovorans]OZC21757.1 HD domain protein [Sporomusa acidovorans DSM 3132]SDD58035.1 HDIG domain-containing protein [Sporomusa acidovorans]
MPAGYQQDYIHELKGYFGQDARRIAHALKVLAYAEKIMSEQPLTDCDRKIVTIAAILHDIGIKNAEIKYGSAQPRYQELEGPGVAAQMMKKYQEPAEIRERVCYIIGGHHTAEKNDGLDFQIIWEADLLVNIAEEGWAKDKDRVKRIIAKHFKTAAGIDIANRTYLA